MRIRDRLRRAWGWASALLAPPPRIPRVSPAPASQSPTAAPLPPPTHHDGPGFAGDRVVVGDVTLRFWPVAELVVLASSEAEAEGALVSLLAHPDLSVRGAAETRLEQLRATRTAAA